MGGRVYGVMRGSVVEWILQIIIIFKKIIIKTIIEKIIKETIIKKIAFFNSVSFSPRNICVENESNP